MEVKRIPLQKTTLGQPFCAMIEGALIGNTATSTQDTSNQNSIQSKIKNHTSKTVDQLKSHLPTSFRVTHAHWPFFCPPMSPAPCPLTTLSRGSSQYTTNIERQKVKKQRQSVSQNVWPVTLFI